MRPAMIRATLLVLACALSACTHSTTTVTSPEPTKGKPTAPVAVTAQLSDASAKVTVTFKADAKDVEVAVRGVDGLVVSGEATRVSGGAFASGESTTFEVAFQRPAGPAALAVSVSGTFNGAKRARVASIAVGEGPGAPTPGEVMTTDDGDTVKVLPAAP
jgi:hypothetical protein